MSLNLTDVKTLIVAPALEALGLNSPAALNLVAGTGLVESNYEYLKQIGTGPAIGLWQMEPATHDDIWATYLPYQPVMAAAVKKLLIPGATLPQLTYNLIYAAAMCRIKYFRAPQKLPVATDANGLALYWKAVYNSDLGAGAVDPAHIASFQSAITA